MDALCVDREVCVISDDDRWGDGGDGGVVGKAVLYRGLIGFVALS